MSRAVGDNGQPRRPELGWVSPQSTNTRDWKRVRLCKSADRGDGRAFHRRYRGGANPILDEATSERYGLDYSLLDISADELGKSPPHCRKICVDVTASPAEFRASVSAGQFDMVVTHNFLEHVRDPAAVHRNIFSALQPGGIAVHFFPTPNNLPLLVNRLTPNWLSRRIVKVFQPRRDLAGHEGKFPAYYRWCGAPSARRCTRYEAIGYEVLRYVGYIGHSYYDHLGVLSRLEVGMRSTLAARGIPLTSCALLVLRKPVRA